MTKFIAAAALAVSMIASPAAFADSTTTVVEEAAYDGGVAGFTSYALRVTSDIDWTNTRLDVQLTQGTMNHVKGSFGASVGPLQELGDTGVFAPISPGELADLGGALAATSLAPGFDEFDAAYNIGWFGDATDTDNIGTYDIAILTFSDDAQGVISGTNFFGSIADDFSIIVGVPEPTTAMLTLFGLVGFAARRRV